MLSHSYNSNTTPIITSVLTSLSQGSQHPSLTTLLFYHQFYCVTLFYYFALISPYLLTCCLIPVILFIWGCLAQWFSGVTPSSDSLLVQTKPLSAIALYCPISCWNQWDHLPFPAFSLNWAEAAKPWMFTRCSLPGSSGPLKPGPLSELFAQGNIFSIFLERRKCYA